MAELQDRNGRLIEIALSSEAAKQHAFKPNQTVWVSASQLPICRSSCLRNYLVRSHLAVFKAVLTSFEEKCK